MAKKGAAPPAEAIAEAGPSVDIQSPPFLIGQARVAKLVVAKMNFAQFARVHAAAEQAALRANSENRMKYYTRERLKTQLRAYDENGTPIPLSEADILNIPRTYATQLNRALDIVDEPLGDILSEGDGIASPILFKLGTPISTGSDGVITELEFSARTYGDVEDVLSATRQTDQVIELLKHCAKPVGGPVNLIGMPSWAAEGLTLTDGIILMDKVLPRFLE